MPRRFCPFFVCRSFTRAGRAFSCGTPAIPFGSPPSHQLTIAVEPAQPAAKTQNSARNINSIRRGAPVPTAPEFSVLVICPKPDEEALPEGVEYCG